MGYSWEKVLSHIIWSVYKKAAAQWRSLMSVFTTGIRSQNGTDLTFISQRNEAIFNVVLHMCLSQRLSSRQEEEEEERAGLWTSVTDVCLCRLTAPQLFSDRRDWTRRSRGVLLGSRDTRQLQMTGSVSGEKKNILNLQDIFAQNVWRCPACVPAFWIKNFYTIKNEACSKNVLVILMFYFCGVNMYLII